MDKIDKAKSICKKLQNHGFVAGFVGGAVRDTFLGKEPHDYDIVTSAKPEQIKELFKNDNDLKAIEVGETFGIVSMWSKKCGCAFEVATFRTDGVYTDGRRPDSVEFTDDVVVDLSRRDFTVNAMFLDPVSGELIDPFDGRKDIENKKIRFVGDAYYRIDEDRLRILRAYRFCAKLGFELSTEADRDICNLMVMNGVEPLRGVSQERIVDEFEKILLTGHDCVSKALAPMARNGLLWLVIPELKAQLRDHDSKWHIETFEDFGTAIISHTFRVVQNAGLTILGHDLLHPDQLMAREDKLRLMWAALLHDVGKPNVAAPNKSGRTCYHKHELVGSEMALEILTRMRLPNKRVAAVASLVRWHMSIHDLPSMKNVASIRKLLGRDDIWLLLNLGFADTAATENEESDLSSRGKDGVKILKDVVKRWVENFPEMLPQPIVTGDDLIAAGLKPSPSFKKALEIAYDEQLRGTINKVKLLNHAVACVSQ